MAVLGDAQLLNGERLRKMVESGMDPMEAFQEGLKFMGTSALALGKNINSFDPRLIASGALGPLSNEFLAMARKIGDKGLDKIIEDIIKEQAQASKGNAAQLAKGELAAKQLGNTLTNLYLTILGYLQPAITEAGTAIAGFINDIAGNEGLKNAISSVGKWFSNSFNEIIAAGKGEGGWKAAVQKALEKAMEGAGIVWDYIKGPVVSAMTSFIDWLYPYFMDLLDSILGAVSDWIYKKTGFGDDPRIRKAQDDVASSQRHINYLQSALSKETDDKKKASIQAELDQKQAELLKYTDALAITKAGIAADIKQGQENATKSGSLSYVTHEADGSTTQHFVPGRHSGTIGMTGNWWEKQDATVNLQAGESVLTQGQLAQIIDTSNQSGLGNLLQQLNTVNVQIAAHLKQIADNTGKTHRATEALSRDLWA
jgi:hypothetical protein